MTNRLENGVRNALRGGVSIRDGPRNAVIDVPGLPGSTLASGYSDSTRLGDVYRCITLLANDMAKLPFYTMDVDTRERFYSGDLMYLLRVRPNEAMTPFVVKQMLKTCVETGGNGYLWIIRNRMSLDPSELIPIPPSLVQPQKTKDGYVWYLVQHPYSGDTMRILSEDMIHLKNWSRDGLTGISTLQSAREAIESGLAAQEFNRRFYASGGRPSGVLIVSTDLGGTVDVVEDGKTVTKNRKDIIREEWAKYHSGAGNSFRTAILDNGLDYKPISVNQADAQFVESRGLTRVDISNFFGVPIYKLNDGKQAYSSNEQNNLEYAGGTLQPSVTQWEEEFSYKLLRDDLLRKGLWLRMNMMSVLRADMAARSAWYEKMRQNGVLSVNDIRSTEDMPDVIGGDVRLASLNYGPLEDFRQLSRQRNGGNK